MQNKETHVLLNEKGQSLVEFMLVLLVVALASFSIKRIAIDQIALRWKSMVETVTSPETVNFN